MAAKKTENTPAPEKRDDSTDTPVTELAQITADTSDARLAEMAGATGDDVSTQQADALDGLKQARDEAGDIDAHNERLAAVNPRAQGPGSDIA